MAKVSPQAQRSALSGWAAATRAISRAAAGVAGNQ